MCWNIVQDRKTAKIDPSLINYPYVANDQQNIYTFGGATTAAGIITWFRDNLAQGEVMKAKENPELSAYKQLDKSASEIPPGSNGLIMLPYFMGERTPIWDPYARGTIIGLTLYHTRAHLFRAFLEGVALSLKDNIEAALKIGVKLDKDMTLIGGGAKSPFWRQIFADVTGFNIKYLSQSYGAPLGDVLLAGVGNKLFDYQEIKKWSKIESIAKPNPENKKIYDNLFKIYRDLYERNKKIYPILSK
jgi:xylulokinase